MTSLTSIRLRPRLASAQTYDASFLLVAFLSEIHAKGAELYLHQQGIDTTTDLGQGDVPDDGVFAEFERAMARERVLAGPRRARTKGKKLGRPMIPTEKERAIQADLAAGLGFRRIMARHGVGTSVIQRIRAELAAEGRHEAPS